MRRLVYHNCYYPDIIYREKMSEIERNCAKSRISLVHCSSYSQKLPKLVEAKKSDMYLDRLVDLAKYDHMAIKSSINDRFLCMIVRNEKKIFVFYFIAGEIFSCLSSRCLLEKIKNQIVRP